MFDFKKLGSSKVPLFSTLSFAVIILLTIHFTSFIPNLSCKSVALPNKTGSLKLPKVVSSSTAKVLFSVKEEIEDNHLQLQPPINYTTDQERIDWFTKVLPKFDILKSTRLSRKFEARVKEFLTDDQCKIQFFMTWISPASSFSDREILAIRSLFKAHPKGCLVILSRTLDTTYGYRVLKPFQDFGNKILVVTPDLAFLFKDTAVQSWFNEITKGKFDPGATQMDSYQSMTQLIPR